MDRKLWVNAAPAIIRPSRELELHQPKVGMEGWFTVQLIRRGIIIKELKFKNLIVNSGLDLLSSGGGSNNQPISGAFTYLAVGTGNAAPAAADTALQAPLSPRTSANGGYADIVGTDGVNKFSYVRRTRLFVESEVNGNLAELGFYTALSGGVLVNRQLFRDDLGNAVVVTKTNQDQLRVIFEWRFYYPLVDVTGTVNLGGTNYDYVIRADGGLDASHWAASTTGGPAASWSFGGLGAGPRMTLWQTMTLAADPGLVTSKGGTQAAASTNTLAAYGNGTFYRDETAIWDPGAGNLSGGIAGISTYEQGSIGGGTFYGNLFVIKFTPNIPKINTQRLTINTRRTWGRYP